MEKTKIYQKPENEKTQIIFPENGKEFLPDLNIETQKPQTPNYFEKNSLEKEKQTKETVHIYFPKEIVSVLEEEIKSGIESEKIPLSIKAKVVEKMINTLTEKNAFRLAADLKKIKEELNFKEISH